MDSVEVTVHARTVEQAVKVGLGELGLTSVDAADVEVIQEGKRGFLGMGGEDAVVRLSPKPTKRRRRRGGRSGRDRGSKEGSDAARSGGQKGGAVGATGSGGGSSKKPDRTAEGTGSRSRRGGSGGGRERSRSRATSQRRGEREKSGVTEKRENQKADGGRRDADPTEQAEIVGRFLTGLLEAFGLEAEVTTSVEDDIILASIDGDQAEALVGQKGAVLQAILELCRTIVQRRSHAGARIRLDIGGYAERRREALRIYAGRLADKVTGEGGEIMLEAMNAADRKAVHDTIGEIDGVRSYSEGEEPNRSVIIAADES